MVNFGIETLDLYKRSQLKFYFFIPIYFDNLEQNRTLFKVLIFIKIMKKNKLLYMFFLCITIIFVMPSNAISAGNPSIRRGYDIRYPDMLRGINLDPDIRLNYFKKKGYIVKPSYSNYRLSNPDWVPPKNRKYYAGYALKNKKMQTSLDWKYRTNRPTGNTKGGGTTLYNDYMSNQQKTAQYIAPTLVKKK